MSEVKDLNFEYLRKYLNVPQFISALLYVVFLGKIGEALYGLANAFKF